MVNKDFNCDKNYFKELVNVNQSLIIYIYIKETKPYQIKPHRII